MDLEELAKWCDQNARDSDISAGMEQEDGDSHAEEFFAGRADAFRDVSRHLRSLLNKGQ